MTEPKDDGSQVVGHKTFYEHGRFRHEPLTRAEADVLRQQCEAADARRKELMPDEESARHLFFDAWLRLKECGWKEACYCPKDRSTFEVIEAGSSGIHKCYYGGEWATGHYMIVSDGDVSPSHPVLFRPIAKEPQA